MFQTGQTGARPDGMNAGNNMAFLQQAQGRRAGEFNPFAPATASRPSAPQNFGASMYATPTGGQFGQQDMGAMLQQFSQPYGGAMGGMFGGGSLAPSPFRGNPQQMTEQMQQFRTPMASSMQNPMIQQQMAAAQQFAPANPMQARIAQMQGQMPANPMQARIAQMQGQMPANPRAMATQLSQAEGRAASSAAQQRRFGGGGRV